MLALEFVDRPDAHTGQTSGQSGDLGVVGGDDQNVIRSKPPTVAPVIHPVRAGMKKACNAALRDETFTIPKGIPTTPASKLNVGVGSLDVTIPNACGTLRKGFIGHAVFGGHDQTGRKFEKKEVSCGIED